MDQETARKPLTPARAKAVETGMRMATRYFANRKGHGENPKVVYVQMGEAVLTALLAAAFELGIEHATTPEPKKTPYPWCHGSPTKADCAERGYCNRDPNCGE